MPYDNNTFENKLDWLIQNTQVLSEKFNFIVESSGSEITYINLVNEFKLYMRTMAKEGYNVIEESVEKHLYVFLLTSGYPIAADFGSFRLE